MTPLRQILLRRLRPLALLVALGAALPATGAAREPGEAPTAAVVRPVGSPSPDAAGASPAGGKAHPLTKADVDAFLDGFMDASLERSGVAGATVSVVADGKLLTARGFGYADVAHRVPVTDQTLFRVGSISKLFTWTAVMQQVEQGRLDLDQDVNRYLDFKIRDRAGRPVTLRTIMTHTAGFEESLRDLITIGGDGRIEPLASFVRTHQPRRVFAAGEVPAYSNYATALAGYIVERVSGQDYPTYVEQHILRPLGMAHTSARLPVAKGLQPSLGYRTADEPPLGIEYLTATPAGVISASAPDMALFMIAHLNGGALPGNEASRILKPETVRLMHDSLRAPAPGLTPMALGFYRDDRNGVPMLAHGGDTIVFHSDLHIMPGRNTGVFVSVNSAGIAGGGHLVRAELTRRFMDRYFPAPPQPAPDPNATYPVTRRPDGMYMASRRAETTLFNVFTLLQQAKVTTDAKGVLTAPFLKTISGAPVRYREIAPDTWQAIGGVEKLGVVRDAQGRITEIATDAEGPITVYQPVPAHKSAAWLLPALGLALLWLVLGLLSWPLGVFYRRRYRVQADPARPVVRAGRWAARIGAVTALGFVYGVFTMVSAITNYQFWVVQSGALPFLRTVQLLALATGVAGLVVAASAAVTWAHAKGQVWAAVGRTGLALSLLLVAYIALVFHVFAPSMAF